MMEPPQASTAGPTVGLSTAVLGIDARQGWESLDSPLVGRWAADEPAGVALPRIVAILAQLGVQVVVPPGDKGASERQLVDVEGIAAALQVSRWSIYRWAAAGRIPSIKAGRHLRFELDEVMAALRREPTAPRASGSRARRAGQRCRLPEHPDAHVGSGPANNAPAPPRPSPQGHLERLRAAVAATRALGE